MIEIDVDGKKSTLIQAFMQQWFNIKNQLNNNWVILKYIIKIQIPNKLISKIDYYFIIIFLCKNINIKYY